MNTKILLIGVVIVVFVAGGAFLFRGGTTEPTPSTDSSGLIIGKNAIYVAEQSPGQSISVAVVRLEEPGFVVIHEDANGAPGKVLGASNLLPTGETKNLGPIGLSRATTDGETMYAMLHIDDGDDAFEATSDKPAKNSISEEPVMTIVTVSADAIEPGAVNP